MTRTPIVALGAALLLTACSSGPDYKTVISGTVAKTTVTLQAVQGRLVVGDNELRLRFTDANQQPVEVTNPAFILKQPASGVSPEAKVQADLKAAGKGQYDTIVSLGSQGNWQGRVTFDADGQKQEWGFGSMVL